MNKYLHCFGKWATLLVFLCLVAPAVWAQPATVSYPFAVGTTSPCGGSTGQIHFYNYNGTTNSISSITATTGPVGRYTPQLRIGTSGGGGGTQRFTPNIASVSFNPKDHNIYYLWTDLGIPRTYVWRWPVGTMPTSTSPRLDTIRSFPADILGVAFDNNGNGYIIEFTNPLPTTPPTYKALIRSIDFTTGILGGADTLVLTGGAKIYQTGSGDVAMSPSGQMFFVVDNKLFTPNYQTYTGTGANLTCTYVDTVQVPSNNFVGLTYAEGETVAAFSGGGCPFREVDPMTGDTTIITRTGTVYSAFDLASVISGIGASKNLVSVTPTGTPNQYDVVYEIYARNYGNTDITNFQITDSLGLINGNANVSNVSISFAPGGNPAGLTLNTAPVTGYTGTGALASNHNLLTGTGTLPNYPTSNNFVTIRIACRLSGIQNGIVYNNSAIAKGTGYNSQLLRDSSTNGSTPDLNGNDKPDDAGEAQPTPLLVAITAQTPPCTTLGQVFYSQDFGTGANSATLPASPSGRTTYTGSTTQPLAVDQFMLTTNANAGDNSRFISLTDNTGGGRMLLVNADAANKVFYSDTLTSLCANQQYTLSFYAAFVGNASYQTICNGFGGFQYPKIKMRVRDLSTGLIITEVSTASISLTSWNQYGMKWLMPAGYTNIIFELINDGQGGCGNDIAIDDIAFGICDAAPTVTVSGSSVGCLGGSTTMSATLSDTAVIPGSKEYQWQISTDGIVWTDIASATASSYTINPVTVTDINKYYRVIVAATGNMSSVNCRYTSGSFLLTAKNSSTAPSGATSSVNNICPGDPATLTVQGGSLGNGAVWRWYTGSCGGTLIGTGASIIVNPLTTTTYYVRAEGDCNITTCASVTITINCDIDKDDDGIPDSVEGTGDTDGDGVANYLDLDSDNDGIPDVVESYGVDANGDGKIDNYTDTDADGFSQNVDGNNTGHLSSGNGLGLPDLDGDGVPNCIDLDSDNDGIPDVREADGADANNDGKIDGYTDTDADGFSDNVDGDVGNDGIAENAANSLLRTGADTNADGRADSYPYKNFDSDTRANPYDLDSDGDGITDVREAGFTDADNNGFSDGIKGVDGWDDAIDALATLTLRNSDGDANLNYLDIDSDNDGIPDNVEGIATSSYQFALNTDTDSDGIDNGYDNVVGFGGNGITPNNQDADGLPDYIDTDTDNDGLSDIVEGNDYNLNRIPDDNVTLTGVDTDGDGLDNRFDASNSSIEGTSQYMGSGGAFVGDGTPGSNTMVQRSYISSPDRDWRYASFILEASFLNFTGNRDKDKVNLRWVITCDKVIDHFDIERSSDGVNFIKVGETRGIGTICRATPFIYQENITGIAGSRIYYRIKAQTTANTYKRSQRIVITKHAVTEILIAPNPASHYLNITCNALRDELAVVDIFDASGKTVIHHQQKVYSGSNTFTIQGVERLTRGVYTIRVKAGLEIIRKKLLIQPY